MSYTPTTWSSGDLITSAKLNKIEQGLAAASDLDSTLAVSGKPADSKAVGDEVTELKNEIDEIEPGLSEDAKAALLACFQKVAWIDDQGQTYYDDLHNALYPLTDLVRIEAVFTQGSTIIYPATPLNDLKAYLVVTGFYTDGRSRNITDYALSGTLTVGTSTVTVTKDSKTDTFTVVVSQPYWVNTLQYLASSGEKLSQTSGFEVLDGVGDMAEVVSNNILNVTLPGSTAYKMIRIANYTPASHERGRIIACYKLNDISSNTDENGVALSIKAGSGCAGLYTHKLPNSQSCYFAIRDSSNSVIDTSKTLLLNTWYTVELLIENNVQTIKIDNETIYSGAANTYFGSSGIVFTKTIVNENVLNVDIENIILQWT